jgi:hypothetical protein
VGNQIDLLQGTLDLLILKAVSLGQLHGFGILLRIQQISGRQLEIEQGLLYTAFIGSSIRAGSPANGANPTTTARRSFTSSPQRDGVNFDPKPKNGIAWHR